MMNVYLQKKYNTRFGLIAFLLFVSFFFSSFLQVEYAQARIENLQAAKTLELIKSNPLKYKILDVRTEKEFNSGALIDAVNIDVLTPSFAKEISKLDKNEHYIVYCRSGVRSLKAIKIMKELGFNNIVNVEEGYNGLKKLLYK